MRFFLFLANTVKDQWRKLRDCHREALRRQQTKSGQQSVPVRLWTYQKQMEFLKSFMKNRTTVGYPEAQQADAAQSDQIADVSVHGNEEPDESNDDVPQSLERPIKRIKQTPVSDPIKTYIHNSEERAKRRDEERRMLLQQSKEEKDSQQNDALFQFFMSMYNITKDLPMRQQRQVRRKLFEAVSNAEDESEGGSMRSGNPDPFSPTSLTPTPEPSAGLPQEYPGFFSASYPQDVAGTSSHLTLINYEVVEEPK